MKTVLSINNLNKRFGKIHAVNDLSLTIEQGSVFGILGPNGSGKTTTLGIILGVINSNSGSFQWFGDSDGKRDDSKLERRRIGAILEQPLFYPYLTALKNLQVVAQIKQVPYSDIERVLKIVELYDRKADKFRTFSYGMKQRLAIAAALLGNPEVLIFDEPTNGLDPQGIAEIRGLILRIAEEGKTILLASHLLDEVQKTCSDVAILKKGKKLYSGNVKEVLNLSDTIEVASSDLQKLKICLNDFPKITRIDEEQNLLLVHMESGLSTENLNTFLVGKGIIVSHLNLRKKSLEQQFLELLSNNQ